MITFQKWLSEANIPFISLAKKPYTSNFYLNVYLLNNTKLIHFYSYSEHSETSVKENNTNITLPYPIQIWEDQWRLKPDIIKSRILNSLNKTKIIAAKNTQFQKINQLEADEFLNSNHLLGSTKAKYKYGLYYGSVLVSVATFSWPRKFYVENAETKLSYALIRHCTLNYLTIQGGLSKIVSNFLNIHKADDILTITDLDWSEGESYKTTGFEFIDKTPPETYYIDSQNHKRFNAKIYSNQDLVNPDFIKIENSGNSRYKLYINKKSMD